LLERTILVFSF